MALLNEGRGRGEGGDVVLDVYHLMLTFQLSLQLSDLAYRCNNYLWQYNNKNDNWFILNTNQNIIHSLPSFCPFHWWVYHGRHAGTRFSKRAQIEWRSKSCPETRLDVSNMWNVTNKRNRKGSGSALLPPLSVSEREAVVDTGQVPEVEDVVELGGRGWEVFDDGLVQLQGAEGHLVTNFLDGLIKGLLKKIRCL